MIHINLTALMIQLY